MGSFLEQSDVRHQFVEFVQSDQISGDRSLRLTDVVVSQISDCPNEIVTTINSNVDRVAFIALSPEKKVLSLRISQDDVVETEYGVLMEADRSFDDAGGSRNECGERKSGRTNLSPTYGVRTIVKQEPER
ncbi:hypothetical protein V1478_016037 [Vespula squamosa]|uniref:Uncharacterized protein n=1 Tax=Vespula squamosa TaxID=30214 RepID=A0ABD2A2Y7_VESSQ